MTNQIFLESVTQEGEEWRDVVGYEGHYAVSSFGRVVCYERYIIARNGHRHYLKGCLMKPCIYGTYPGVSLYLNKKRKVMYIHRLVAKMFIPNPENKPYIDHIDCDIHNNHIGNLRWVTQKENLENPITRRRAKANFCYLRNELNGRSTPVVRINPNNSKDLKIYPSQSEAFRDGFTQGAVSASCRGTYPKPTYKGYCWMYLSDYEALNQ